MIRTLLIVTLLCGSSFAAQDYLDTAHDNYKEALRNLDKNEREYHPPVIPIPQQNKNSIIFAPISPYQGQGLLSPQKYQFNNYLLLY